MTITDYDNQIVSLANKLHLDIFSDYKEHYDANKPFNENLYNMLYLQNSITNDKIINRKIKSAGFPYIKTFDQFEYTKENLPKLNFDSVTNLFDCDFIKTKNDIIMIGQPGKGKTHLSIALGIEAIRHNYTVKFYSANNLVLKLSESKTNKSLDRAMTTISRCDLLIIDEIGYIKYDKELEKHLFEIISNRYERKSTIITTNFRLSDWCDFNWNKKMTEAIVDRLSHHSVILDMTGGRSYRIDHAYSKKN
jgi:DNA replication protein DnaC